MALLVGTGITPGYYGVAQQYGYLEGLARLSQRGVTSFCVLLDFEDEKVEELEWINPSLLFVRMSSSELKTHNPKSCLQHGEFLERLTERIPITDDDYVLYTDADIRIQRKFADVELELFESGRVFVAMNWHDHETLAEELTALQARVPVEEIERAFPGYRTLACYNTGVLGMRVPEWRRLFGLYNARFSAIDPLLGHYAKQQWLLCYLLQTEGFSLMDPLSELVRDIHCHGHHPQAPKDNRITRDPKTGLICRHSDPILFAHRLG